MKSVVIDSVHDLPGIVSLSFNDTNPVHFLFMCFNLIKWVQKTRKMYGPKT